jgi:hypothetical protein
MTANILRVHTVSVFTDDIISIFRTNKFTALKETVCVTVSFNFLHLHIQRISQAVA